MEHETDLSQVSSDSSKLHDFHLVTLVDPHLFEGPTAAWLWEKVKTQDYAFDDKSRNNPTTFCLTLLAEQTAHFFIGPDASNPVGWCVVRNLYEGSSPDIHFVIWDKNFTANQAKAAGREVLDWLFKSFSCNRVTAMVPDYNPDAKRLALLLRFQHEGVMREATLFHGRWCNVNMFGLLKKDFYYKVQ